MLRQFRSVRRPAWVLLGAVMLFTTLSVIFRVTDAMPSKVFLYVFQPLSAAAIAGLAFYYAGGAKDRVRRQSDKAFMVGSVFVVWFVLYFLSGLATTYVRNTLVATPTAIMLNLFGYGLAAFAIEYVRHKTILLAGRRNVVWFGIVLALVLALQQLNVSAFAIAHNPEEILKLVVSDVIPVVVSSLLLTYLAISSGLPSMLVYKLGLVAVTILLPIIPKYDWYLTGISALLLAIGIYLVIDRSQQGKQAEHRRHYTHMRRAYDAMSLIVLVGLVLLMTGFFKYKPMVILSDSMMPLYGRGSMVIVNAIDSPLDVQVGDVIQFRGADKVITHRVEAIDQADDGSGSRVFITKGDNNPSKDPPVPEKEVMGIVKAQIPYIGYPTVWLRTLAR